MAIITITEALADLKTIEKRITSKRTYIQSYLFRPEEKKDPLEKAGGSGEVIRRELQAIADLQQRHVAIRAAIQKINQTTNITLGDVTKTIGEWLTWRKEIAPGEQLFVAQTQRLVQQARAQAHKIGVAAVAPGGQAQSDKDIVINVDEAALAAKAEALETILGTLDGLLSLKNATTTIEI